MVLIADHGLPVELQVVDLSIGEHLGDGYAALNPSRLVPPPQAREFLRGDQITIADHFGAAFVHLVELVGSDLGRDPNLGRWLRRTKARPSWAPAYAAIEGFATQLPRRELTPV